MFTATPKYSECIAFYIRKEKQFWDEACTISTYEIDFKKEKQL